jgi:hypothetical protein
MIQDKEIEEEIEKDYEKFMVTQDVKNYLK